MQRISSSFHAPVFRLRAGLLISALLVAGSVSVFGQQKAERTWPNWMGPGYDGVSRESAWSTAWPDDGLKQLWTTEIGTGFSSLSIADGRIFTMGHAAGRETVWCLNADTGALLWKHDYPEVLNDHLYEGGPGATPTIDGEFLYTLGVGGRLFCFRRSDGSIVWQKSLQDELGLPMHEWGYNSSPRILGDQLLI
ncbi:MAG: PQQ-binding-like beta-propeller repeat protein, partial [Planctomycetaceae bacterium]|nr:PQQ-binding-like beta-propeller repeat protein [Planctomycetaceae bacterium]